MSGIPEPINLIKETYEGQRVFKTDRELLEELVMQYNNLVIYLDSISERL